MNIRVALALALTVAGATAVLDTAAKVTRGPKTEGLLALYQKLESRGDLKNMADWQVLEYKALRGETLTNSEQKTLDNAHKKNGPALLRFNEAMFKAEREEVAPMAQEEADQTTANEITQEQAKIFENELTVRADAIKDVTGISVANLIKSGLEACMEALEKGQDPDTIISDIIAKDYYSKMLTAAQGNTSDEDFANKKKAIEKELEVLNEEDSNDDQAKTVEDLQKDLDGIEHALEAEGLPAEQRAALEETRDQLKKSLAEAKKSMSWRDWAAAKGRIALSVATSRKTLAVVGIAVVGGVAMYYNVDVILPYAQAALDAITNAGTCALGTAKGVASYMYNHCLSSAATATTVVRGFWSRLMGK